jgi:hypothetical protein
MLLCGDHSLSHHEVFQVTCNKSFINCVELLQKLVTATRSYVSFTGFEFLHRKTILSESKNWHVNRKPECQHQVSAEETDCISAGLQIYILCSVPCIRDWGGGGGGRKCLRTSGIARSFDVRGEQSQLLPLTEIMKLKKSHNYLFNSLLFVWII